MFLRPQFRPSQGSTWSYEENCLYNPYQQDVYGEVPNAIAYPPPPPPPPQQQQNHHHQQQQPNYEQTAFEEDVVTVSGRFQLQLEVQARFRRANGGTAEGMYHNSAPYGPPGGMMQPYLPLPQPPPPPPQPQTTFIEAPQPYRSQQDVTGQFSGN